MRWRRERWRRMKWVAGRGTKACAWKGGDGEMLFQESRWLVETRVQ